MPRRAGELAQYLGATLEGDDSIRVASISNPDTAAADDLIYADQEKFRARAQASRALCLIAPPGLKFTGKTVIRVTAAKLAFAKAAAWLLPERKAPSGIHASAVISPLADIAPSVAIGPFVVIEEGVSIKSGTEIGAFCFLGAGASLGENCRLYPRVTLYPGAKLGSHVILHSNVVIGGDGFGYVFGEGKHWKFPQVGAIEIGDDVEIGCGTTIDRGSLGTTRIAPGAKIDNLVQIGHNVAIGENTLIAAQVGISGSCTIGSNVMLGGQAGLGEHCTLEDGVIAGGQSGILPGKIVRSGAVVWGTPARPLAQFKEEFAWYRRLPIIGRRLRRESFTE